MERGEGTWRILLIDDSVDACEALGDLLRHLGHEVVVGHDGRTAFELAQTFHPNVVLLDIGLPDISGLDVARRLRCATEFSETVLIALSGYGGVADRARAREAGFDHQFTKPLDLGALRRLLSDTRRPSVEPG